jgi:hypothetical protein
MAQQPTLKREGNLRFAGVLAKGYPEDPAAMAAEVRQLLGNQGVRFLGPAFLLFSLAPEGKAREWECCVGTALTGLPRPPHGVVIEDYSGLYALTQSHTGSIQELANTHRLLYEHGRSLGYQCRPYWRVSLWRKRLADGNPLPATEVSVFLDR